MLFNSPQFTHDATHLMLITFELYEEVTSLLQQPLYLICSLILQSEIDMDMQNVLEYNTLYPIECLDLHLTEISLNDYRGNKPDIDFTKFFVLYAKVLKVMRFGIIYKHNDKWWANQCRRLHVINKASREADFEFMTFTGFGEFYYTSVTKDTHDLLVDDPFDSSL